MKMNRLCLLLVAAALIFPGRSFAGGSSCSSATGLIPDGRGLDFDSVQPGGTVYYSFSSVAGRSYSIEVRDDIDSDPGTDLQIQYYSQATSPGCTSPMTPPPIPECAPPAPGLGISSSCGMPFYAGNNYRDTTNIEPKLVSGQRISIPAASTDTIVISVSDKGTSAHYVFISVSETTLYSAEINTYGNLNTFVSLNNTTSAPLTYNLQFVGTQCSPISPATTCTPQTVTDNTTIAPNIAVFKNSATAPLLMNAQQVGYAILTHDGPPAALQATLTIGYFGSLPYSMIAYPFGPVREHR